MNSVIFECTVDEQKLNELLTIFKNHNEKTYSYVESIESLIVQEGMVPFDTTHQLVRYFSKKEEVVVRPLKKGLIKLVITTDEPTRWNEEDFQSIDLDHHQQIRMYYLEQTEGQPFSQAKICRYRSSIGEVYRWMEVIK